MSESNGNAARQPQGHNSARIWRGKELEQLERRELMSASPQPLSLDFSSAVASTVVDKSGKGTGFSGYQAGSAASVALNTTAGTLAMTADYSASKPTTALQTTFDGSTRGFTITARLIGPLSNLNHTSDQAGIYIGNDVNNTIKLVAIKTDAGEFIQFEAIVGGKIVGTDSLTYQTAGTAFSGIKTLDLQIVGDSVTGTATARFSVNGRTWIKITRGVTLPTASVASLFNTTSKAGLIVSDRHGPITATFDSFSVVPGTAAAPVVVTTPTASISRNFMAFSDITTTSAASAAQTVRITNTGTGNLTITAATFGGDFASEYSLTNPITSAITLAPGQRYDFYVQFKTSTANVIHNATLSFTTNSTTATQTISLRGLGLGGVGGSYEPSLQRIIDLYQIPISTGEADTNDNNFPVDTATANSKDEVAMQQLVAVNGGTVTIELLGAFANQVSATSIGWYEAGNPQTTYKLGSVSAANAQSIAPLDDGSITFSPGTKSFGLYGNFTLGSAAKPINRNVYSEAMFNTWETNTSRQKKVRFYQMRDSNGNVVANTYVFAFEEYNVTFDQNDIVGIIRNVQPAAAGPEIGLQNMDGVPAADQGVMSRVEHKNPDLVPAQTDHDTVTFRINNSGTQPLTITGMVLSDSNFVIVSGGGAQTIAAGKYATVVVKFVYSNPTALGNKLIKSTLTVSSNDSDEPTKTIKLSGIWTSYSENQPNGVSAEPTAEQVIEAYGYSTTISTSTSPINTHGANIAAGDEVLSQLWQRADTGLPVTVQMLATYHQVYDVQWNTHSTLYTYDPTVIDSATGKPKVTKLLSHEQQYSQSVLPTIDGSMTNPAIASWIPSMTTFGFNIDGQANGTYSQDQYNTPNDAGNAGHGWRFYVARDAQGNIIPDTYIACQDYVKVAWANYDYQDNILLITNVKPAQAPQVVQGLKATSSTSGTTLSWTANTAKDVTGYNVYRALTADGTFTKITSTPVASTTYTDPSAVSGTTYYYYVTAVAYQGGESAASAKISATGVSLTAPTAASGLAATANSATSVTLKWADNSTNESGFRIERSTAGGAWTVLTTTAAGVTTYTDTTTAASTSYSYRVVATNSVGDAAATTAATVTTPAASTTPTNPTNPTTPTASLSSTDIGNPTPAGQVTTVTDGKDYNVTVGGVDIYGTLDSFNYVYAQQTGDFDVAVHITGLTNVDPSTMAGIMVRESLASGARNIHVKVRPQGYRVTYRTATNGATTATGSGTADLSNSYVRMQRSGNTFNCYGSSDGKNWTLISTVTMALGSTVYLGLATCGKSTTTAATAQYRNYGATANVADSSSTGTGTTTTPVVGTTPPTTVAQTILASADAYVYDGATTTNFGTSPSLQIKKSSAGFNRQTLLTFDISSLTSLTSAKLRLYTNLNTADSVQIAAYAAASTFSEGDVTWKSAPTTTGSVLGTAIVTSTVAGWTEIDLTSYVQQAIAAGKTTITINLQGTANSTAYVNVASRDSGASTAPQLAIT